MAEEAGEKSFEATPHRRDEARKQGQVAFSQDLGSAALLVVAAMGLRNLGPALANSAAELLRSELGTVPDLTASTAATVARSHAMLSHVGAAMVPLLLLLIAAGVASSVFQTGLMFVPERLMPDISRLSPLAGLGRIFSLQSSVRLGFGLLKVLIVSAVATAVLWPKLGLVLHSDQVSTPALATLVIDVLIDVVLWVGVALLVLAIFDYGFQWWKHEQDLRMTQQEMRDELKNMQGDPQVAAKRRQIQRQMVMHRIGSAVPKADVVVTNPTELAVALQYDPQSMAAPVVVAKGAGVLAQRIRRLALEHGVPVVERKPLAQLLYKEVDINRPVPGTAYAAVAEVLAYVYRLKGKKIPGAA